MGKTMSLKKQNKKKTRTTKRKGTGSQQTTMRGKQRNVHLKRRQTHQTCVAPKGGEGGKNTIKDQTVEDGSLQTDNKEGIVKRSVITRLKSQEQPHRGKVLHKGGKRA